jgi:methionine-rich copper-binding protein CopC
VVSDGTDTLRNIEFLVFADTTAPGVPVIGAATAGDQSATVSFNAPTAGSVTEFSVRVLDAGDAQVGELRTAAADARSLQVTGLTNGTAYRFQVRASNDKGDSDFSAPSNTVTPQAPPVVPSAPTIGQVTAGSASATVRWVAGSDGGAPVTGYQVEAFDNAGALVRSQSAPASSRSLVVTDLANQTTYTFQVRAVNVAGTGAASARSAAVTPRTEFVAPVVSTRTPVDGAKVVSQTGHLTAGFSEPVTGLSTRTFTLKLGSTAVPATVSFTSTGRTATLNPKADLAADRTYTATLSGLKDRAGNAMAATSWSFTTGPAPRVVRTTPASNAKGVRRDANLTVTFDEAITGQSSSTVRLTRVTGGGAVTAPVSLDAKKRVLTLNPSSSLAANTQYRVTVTGGATAVRDLAGNPAATRTWTFSTGSVR